MSTIQKLITFLYSKDIRENKGVNAILNVDILIIFFSLLVFSFFYFVQFEQGAIISGFALLASLAFLVLPYITQNLNYLGLYFTVNTLILCFSLMYFTGGVSSPFQFLVFCISPVSYTFFKREVAFKHTMLTLGCYLGFAIFQFSSGGFHQHMALYQLITSWLFCFSLTTIFFIFAIRNYNSGLRKKSKEVKNSNEKLLKSNEELERFAYIASHDLKSPLRNILSFVQLLEKKYSNQLDEKGNEFVRIISTNADQMHLLIEDILEYSKSSNREAKKEMVDLNKVLDQVSNQILGNDRYSDCQIICPIELPTITSDFTLLKQVFQNLIENGLKYNKSFKKIISIQFLEKRDEFYFMIKDNGIGISEKYLDQIFEMFKRLHTKSEYLGTGIGLSVCRNFIDNMGGKIWVTSKEGEGSIFHISLPKSSSNQLPNGQNKELEESVLIS